MYRTDCEVPKEINIAITQYLQLRLGQHHARGTRKYSVRFCFLEMTEKTTSMLPQQYGCINQTQTMVSPIGIPVQMGLHPLMNNYTQLMTADRGGISLLYG